MLILKTLLVDETNAEGKRPLVVRGAPDGGYLISREGMGEGPPIHVKVDDLGPWERRFYYWSICGDGFVPASHFEDSRDYDSFMKSRYGCPEGVVFVTARGGNDEFIVVTLVPTRPEVPFVHHEGYGPSIEAIEKVLPGFISSQRAKSNKAKRDLLEQINPMAVMSEMEKQLDLLTSLVISLAEKQPTEEQPDWLPQLKAVVEQQGSTQFKGPSGSLQDILERKQSLREIQRKYFEERGY